METKRITTWDVAKGLGMLLVMLGHLLPETSYLRSVIYSFHMPLFFILSGFVLKHDDKNRSLVELIKSEKRMIIVYLFWSAIYLGVDMIVKFILLKSMTLLGLVKQAICIFTTYGINVLWFVGSLIVGRILARAILSSVDNNKIRWAVTAAFVVVPAALSPVLDLINSWSVSVILIVILRGTFASGLILFGHLIKDRMMIMIEGGYSLLGVLLLLVNMVIVNYMGKVDFHYMELGVWPLFLVSMLTGTFGFICLCRQLEKFEPVKNGLVFLGVNSLFIMVTHNYLYINDGITYVVGLIMKDTNLIIAVSFVLLLAVEIVLCRFVVPIYNKLIGRFVG